MKGPLCAFSFVSVRKDWSVLLPSAKVKFQHSKIPLQPVALLVQIRVLSVRKDFGLIAKWELKLTSGTKTLCFRFTFPAVSINFSCQVFVNYILLFYFWLTAFINLKQRGYGMKCHWIFFSMRKPCKRLIHFRRLWASAPPNTCSATIHYLSPSHS